MEWSDSSEKRPVLIVRELAKNLFFRQQKKWFLPKTLGCGQKYPLTLRNKEKPKTLASNAGVF